MPSEQEVNDLAARLKEHDSGMREAVGELAKRLTGQPGAIGLEEIQRKVAEASAKADTAAIAAFLRPMLAEVTDDVWAIVEAAYAYQQAAQIEASHPTRDTLDRLERARGDFRLALTLTISKAPDKLTTPFLILRHLRAEVARGTHP